MAKAFDGEMDERIGGGGDGGASSVLLDLVVVDEANEQDCSVGLRM